MSFKTQPEILSDALRVALEREKAMRDTLTAAQERSNELLEEKRALQRELDSFLDAVDGVKSGAIVTDCPGGWTMLSSEKYTNLLVRLEELEREAEAARAMQE